MFETKEEGNVKYRKKKDVTHWRNYHRWWIWCNKAWRDASLVANKETKFLFEYSMPNGKEYLAEVELDRHGYFGTMHKPVNRNNPPVVWREAVQDLAGV